MDELRFRGLTQRTNREVEEAVNLVCSAQDAKRSEVEQ